MSRLPVPPPSVHSDRQIASLALVGSDRHFPVPRHLHKAACLLCELEYTGVAVDAILDHLARHGTAEHCRWIDPPHRGMVEETLPMAPAAEWLAHDDGVWMADHEVADPTCSCAECVSILRAYREFLALVDPSEHV